MDNCNKPILNRLKEMLRLQGIRTSELPTIQKLDGSEGIPIVKDNIDYLVNLDSILDLAEASFFSAEAPSNWLQAISTVPKRRRKIGMVVSFRENLNSKYKLIQYVGELLDTVEYFKVENWAPVRLPSTNFIGVFPSIEALNKRNNEEEGAVALVGNKPNDYELYRANCKGEWISIGKLVDIRPEITADPVEVIQLRRGKTVSDMAYTDHLGNNIASTYVTRCALRGVLAKLMENKMPDDIREMILKGGECPSDITINVDQVVTALLDKMTIDDEGYLLLDGHKTNTSLRGPRGYQGNQGEPGAAGKDGKNGKNGVNGQDGLTPEFKAFGNELKMKYTNEPDTEWRTVYTFPSTPNPPSPPSPPPTPPNPEPDPDYYEISILSGIDYTVSEEGKVATVVNQCTVNGLGGTKTIDLDVHEDSIIHEVVLPVGMPEGAISTVVDPNKHTISITYDCKKLNGSPNNQVVLRDPKGKFVTIKMANYQPNPTTTVNIHINPTGISSEHTTEATQAILTKVDNVTSYTNDQPFKVKEYVNKFYLLTIGGLNYYIKTVTIDEDQHTTYTGSITEMPDTITDATSDVHIEVEYQQQED